MITVYHNKRFLDFNLKPDKVLKEMAAGLAASDLVRVADVESGSLGSLEGLERAFELTNHIDRAWQENPGVTAYKSQARSTSVGDVMESGGKRYIVAGLGMLEI